MQRESRGLIEMRKILLKKFFSAGLKAGGNIRPLIRELSIARGELTGARGLAALLSDSLSRTPSPSRNSAMRVQLSLLLKSIQECESMLDELLDSAETADIARF